MVQPNFKQHFVSLVVTPKIKTKKVVQTLDLISHLNPQSGVGNGSSTLRDGLTYGDFPYGTRVQDRQICMNIPDVIMVYGIFQGSGEETPITFDGSCIDGWSNKYYK